MAHGGTIKNKTETLEHSCDHVTRHIHSFFIVESEELLQEFEEMAEYVLLTSVTCDEVISKAQLCMVRNSDTSDLDGESHSFTDFDFDEFG